MVNAPPTTDRRERIRPDASQHALGQTQLNPFGDLHTLQHLSARLARALKGVWEPLLRREVRSWAEPLAVQRFADYRAERSDTLTAWLPMTIGLAGGQPGTALIVLDGGFVLEMLDLFFGGNGAAIAHRPTEFSPAADAMIARLGSSLASQLKAAWEPLAKLEFRPGRVENNAAAVTGIDADDAAVVTRFGLAGGTGSPVFVDILYPVSALKPHAATLTGKVLDKAEPDPAWRSGLARSVMNVRFPVRSVLAEPVVPLQVLLALKPGDVIPITVAAAVPVMVGRDRLGAGTVGTSNGRAAIQLTSLHRIEGIHP
ncbi:MAG: flagellar motor switch protein FliM [Sphingomonas bacterium]|uniref:flagellar motor switch protein FliM n=1 Tax=Sphingomonas bacterium TaxID=1895847 RepID=UPI0026254DA3|nr:flagellar motor switch protein FliM [Sphingomonas bacterium]MDB5694833.1 flagellar motor switch protein FliM [Sphingomonas bacterium]